MLCRQGIPGSIRLAPWLRRRAAVQRSMRDVAIICFGAASRASAPGTRFERAIGLVLHRRSLADSPAGTAGSEPAGRPDAEGCRNLAGRGVLASPQAVLEVLIPRESLAAWPVSVIMKISRA